jgi:hypothetical protein
MGKHAKWLQEVMTKGMAAVNATCCMDRESCINVVKCDGKGMEDSADGWRTPEVSWLDMEGANSEEVLIVNMMRAEEEEPPNVSQTRRNSWHRRNGRNLKEKKIEAEDTTRMPNRRGRIYTVRYTGRGVGMRPN